MKKRVIASILCLTMLVVCLAGCTSSAASSTSSSGGGAQSSSKASSAETPSEPVKLKVAFDTHPDDKVDANLPWFLEWQKKTNTILELIPFPSENAEEKKNAMLASNDLPDLFEVDRTMANLYGPEGVFIPLTDELLSNNAPNIWSMITPETTVHLRNSENGNLYFMPRHWGLQETTEGFATYRKDLLEEMKETEPNTMAEWTALLKKAKAAYPDMVILSERNRNLDVNMATAFGIGNLYRYNYCVTIQGGIDKVQFTPTTENMKDLYKFYAELYAEGILDNGYQTIEYGDWWDKNICGGKAFACFSQNFNRAYEATETAHQVGLDNVQWWVAKHPENPYTNERVILKTLSPWTTMGWAITAQSKAQEEAVRFADYLFSDEGITFFTYGIEGETYNMVNGQPERIPNDNMMEFVKKRTEIGYAFYLPSYNGIADMGYYTDPIMVDHFDKNGPLCKPIAQIVPIASDVETINEFLTELDTYWKNMMDRFIRGELDIDKEWDAYVAECNRLGAEKGLALVQGWVDTYYNALKK